MAPIVIDIAYFLEDPQARERMLKSSAIRAKALEIAYQIPGYKDLHYTEKAPIYDRIVEELTKEA